MSDSLSSADRDARIAAIAESLAAATPGPWTLVKDNEHSCTVRARGEVISGVVAFVRTSWVHADQRAEQARNAAFIAAAPDHVAFLLAELRAALSREEEAKKGLAYLFGEIGFPLRHRWGGDAKEFTEGVLIAARSVSLSENG